jgi:hypothetical protein
MTHRLLNFGDSWAYGAELEPRPEIQQLNYSACLGKLLGVDSVEHFAMTASSVSHMVVQFYNFVDKFYTEIQQGNTKYTAVFFLTAKQRFMMKYQEHWVFLSPLGAGALPGTSTALTKHNEMYFKYIYNDEHCDLMFNNDVILLQALCRKYNVDDYYIAGWQDFAFRPQVDLSKIYKQGKVTCAELVEMKKNLADTFDPDPNNQYLRPNISHPNALGHQKIAHHLYEWLKSTAIIN